MTDPVYTLTVDGSDEAFRVDAVSGRESIHAPSSFTVACAAIHGDAAALLGATATLSWAGSGEGEPARTVEGVVDAVEQAHGACTLTLIPRVAAALSASDHRVFVDRDAADIAEAILGEHGVLVERRLSRALPRRAQCLQHFEGDLDFVGRILAEEGIAWCCQPDGRGVFFADHPAAYQDLGGDPLLVGEEGGLRAAQGSVHGARLAQRAVPGEVVLRDYDFEHPLLDLDVAATAGSGGARLFEFPGGYADPAVGRALASARLEEARQRRRVLRAQTSARGLSAGAVITLQGARPGMSGRFLVLEVTHEGSMRAGGERVYGARFSAVPAEVGFRPERRRAPGLGGVQTAVVTGPPGAEIHPDEHARVRVKHRWDRRGPSDDRSSAWARTSQPAMSGSIFLPRLGWEVLVGFGGARGDEPLVLGRLANGAAPPPNKLPAEKVVSALGTLTSPGGGSRNRLAMTDTAGSEGMAFNASSDFDERTENDKVTAVKAADTWAIGGSRKLIVGTVLEQHVGGAESFTVGGMRKVDVAADINLQAASETVAIGALRGIHTGGDHSTTCSTFARVVGGGEAQAAIEHQNKHVKGVSVLVNGAGFSTAAGAGASLGVGGASALRVGGPKSITCAEYTLTARGLLSEKYPARAVTAGGPVKETYSISSTVDVSGAATLHGSDVSVKGSASITIKAGGVTITMTPGKIKISGRFDGSVASGEKGSHRYG